MSVDSKIQNDGEKMDKCLPEQASDDHNNLATTSCSTPSNQSQLKTHPVYPRQTIWRGFDRSHQVVAYQIPAKFYNPARKTESVADTFFIGDIRRPAKSRGFEKGDRPPSPNSPCGDKTTTSGYIVYDGGSSAQYTVQDENMEGILGTPIPGVKAKNEGLEKSDETNSTLGVQAVLEPPFVEDERVIPSPSDTSAKSNKKIDFAKPYPNSAGKSLDVIDHRDKEAEFAVNATITFDQTLKNVRLELLKSAPCSTDVVKGQSSNVDEAASLNTQNEYWSVSSYHTRSLRSEDGDELAEGIPPPDLSPDFVLPVDSLLKPIKKNTYSPITQENVAKFHEGATWFAEIPIEQTGTMWTVKKVPLEPVAVRSASPSPENVQLGRQRDSFLESIQVTRSDQVVHSSRIRERSRFHRYPGADTVYSEYMKEEVLDDDSYGILYVKRIRRISTQSTNPPDVILRCRRQEMASTDTQQSNVVAALPPPITHKVQPLDSLVDIGMYHLL